MTFKAAVEATPEIENAWRAGLQALRGVDRQHVAARNTRCLGGSVNLDRALNDRYPNDARWDYAVGYRAANRRAEMVYWVEIHPASSSHVEMILRKLAWLQRWLRNKAPRVDELKREFVWVSSGRTSFTQTSTQAKRLALHGLRHTGRVLRLGS